MFKTLSLILTTLTLTTTAFATDSVLIREQNLNRCKKSSQSTGDYLIKECSKKLSFNNRILISGFSFEMSETETENRLDLLILDKRGAHYYMPAGVFNSTFEPHGKIEIVKTGDTDKAIVYRLNYSAFDSEESYFKLITIRLRANLINPRKTCVVAISDSKDNNIQLSDKTAAKILEKDFRANAKDFILSKDFAKASCIEFDHNHNH